MWFKSERKRSRAELKILQLELRLEPARLGLITNRYRLGPVIFPSQMAFYYYIRTFVLAVIIANTKLARKKHATLWKVFTPQNIRHSVVSADIWKRPGFTKLCTAAHPQRIAQLYFALMISLLFFSQSEILSYWLIFFFSSARDYWCWKFNIHCKHSWKLQCQSDLQSHRYPRTWNNLETWRRKENCHKKEEKQWEKR